MTTLVFSLPTIGTSYVSRVLFSIFPFFIFAFIISFSDIILTNGTPLLGMYGSLIDIFKNVIPEENDWQPWCFVPPNKTLWNNKENHRKYLLIYCLNNILPRLTVVIFFEWIAKEHNITKIDDWYNLRVTDVRKYGAKLVC